MSTLVSVAMGSRSDWQTMKYVTDILSNMSISHEVLIVSARRDSDQINKYLDTVEEQGVQLIIASASGTVHLPGLLALKTKIPVLAVPLEPKTMKREISLAQMPTGVPVGTLATGYNGAVNAALLAASMLANKHNVIRKALSSYRTKEMTPALLPLNSSVAV